LYFDGSGEVTQIVGGYDDVDSYLVHKDNQRKQVLSSVAKSSTQTEKSTSATEGSAKVNKRTKLSYKELRELELLPDMIDSLESEIATLQQQVNDVNFFSQEVEKTNKILNQLAQAESKLDATYARWQELDDI
jgi:ATP-binding cassette subfamily F protein uup